MKLILPRRWATLYLLALVGIPLLAGCGGPRAFSLTSETHERRPSIYPIEVFLGRVSQPYREIAVIESSAYADDDDATRVKQVEQLQKKARRLGADAVQEVRILAKEVRGFTADERTPFPTLKQGEYPLYFMRATAIIFESSLPGSVAERRGFRLRGQPRPKPLPSAEPEKPDS